MTVRFLVWLTLAAVPVAWAQPHQHQPAPPAKTPDKPAATSAPAIPGKSEPYLSAFADYRRFNADEPMVDWRRINDEMAGLGGHAGHSRGTAAPNKDAPKQDAPSKPADHSQHGGKR